MRLATSTNILFARPDGTNVSMEHTLEKAKEAGFDRFDLCFYDWVLPGSPFLTDDWRTWIDSIAETITQLGVSFGQCHMHFYNFLDPRLTPEQHVYQEMLVRRSLECCSILGSKLCVTHPETDYLSYDIVKSSKAKNLEYFKRLLEYATSFDMDLALENMTDYSIAPQRKYFVTTEEMVDFVSEFNDPRMGLCWDFEHAVIMKQNQRDSLLHLGKHLTATHVSDTHSLLDPKLMHVLPLFGDINWKEVMDTLREIQYKGDFSFEAHNFANKLPDALLPTGLKLAYEMGVYLMQL